MLLFVFVSWFCVARLVEPVVNITRVRGSIPTGHPPRLAKKCTHSQLFIVL